MIEIPIVYVMGNIVAVVPVLTSTRVSTKLKLIIASKK